jgi:hypothetical protein
MKISPETHIMFAIVVILGIVVLIFKVKGIIASFKAIDLHREAKYDQEHELKKLQETRQEQRALDEYNLFDASGSETHPLGDIQDIIHSKKASILTALGFLISVAVIVKEKALDKVGFQKLIADSEVVLVLSFGLVGVMVFVIGLFSYAVRKVVLRRKGFELFILFFKKSYEYKDLDFYLVETETHKQEGTKVRSKPAHLCHIMFKDGRKPIVLTSAVYANLQEKIQKLIDAIYKGKVIDG